MIRVNNRMNIYTNDEWEADRMRAQMDYHMFLAHALGCQRLPRAGGGWQDRPGSFFHLHLPSDQQTGGRMAQPG